MLCVFQNQIIPKSQIRIIGYILDFSTSFVIAIFYLNISDASEIKIIYYAFALTNS